MTVIDFGQAWTIYTYRDALRAEIEIETNWRKTRGLRGRHILTDNWFVVPVIADSYSHIKLPKFSVKRTWMYAMYPVVRRQFRCGDYKRYTDVNYKFQRDIELTRLKQRFCPTKPAVIELLLAKSLIENNFNPDAAIKEVWGATTLLLRTQLRAYVNHRFVQELLMDKIKEAFNGAKINLANLLSRLDNTSELLVSMLEIVTDDEKATNTRGAVELARETTDITTKLADLYIRAHENTSADSRVIELPIPAAAPPELRSRVEEPDAT